MAKKSRRAKRSTKKKRATPAIRPKQPVTPPGVTVVQETEAPAQMKAAQLAKEYRYVYSDLKRIAILAGVMLAALILLAFVIR